MSNVVDINKLRVDAILKKIKKQEDFIEKANLDDYDREMLK